MRDGLYEMVRDASRGNADVEHFVRMASALLREAARLSLGEEALPREASELMAGALAFGADPAPPLMARRVP